MQDTALNPEEIAVLENERIREEEEKEENDDLQELEKKRAFDEWKDEHKRGEGNRKNMGWFTPDALKLDLNRTHSNLIFCDR